MKGKARQDFVISSFIAICHQRTEEHRADVFLLLEGDMRRAGTKTRSSDLVVHYQGAVAIWM